MVDPTELVVFTLGRGDEKRGSQCLIKVKNIPFCGKFASSITVDFVVP